MTDVITIVGLSIIILVCLTMLAFLLLIIIQEAISKNYGKKLINYLKEKDKQID